MINPLNELSDIYLGSISEADNSPEAIKGRVMQHVRAIRYRARKEGDQLTKAYNDYMAGQAGISATEKSMVKERLGLTGGAQHQEGMAYGLSKGTGKPTGAMAAFGKKKTKKTKPTVTIDKPDRLVSLRVSKEGFSDWRIDLSEYTGMMPKKSSEEDRKVTEKKVKNKITVNPLQGQAESFAQELGGKLIEAFEVYEIKEVGDEIQLLEVKDRKGKGSGSKDACYHKVKSRYSVWPSAYASGALVKCRRVGAANWGNSAKNEDVQWKDVEYQAKSGKSTFLSDSDGNIAFEIVDVIVPAVAEEKKPMVKVKLKDPSKIKVKVTDIGAGGKEYVRKDEMSEDYETKKREEIMGALKKRDLKQKVKEKIAADIIKRKGDTSKSDDRYAYESVEVVSEGPLGAVAGGALGAMVGGPVGAVAGAALGSKVDVLGGGKKKTKAVKPTPKPTPNVDAEKVKAARRAKIAKMLEKEKLNKEEVEPVDEACWKGYEKKGMKKMFGKMYPNCVKKKTKSEEVEYVDEAKYEAGASTYGKASIRNKRAYGYGGNAKPPAERGAAITRRTDEHKARRNVKKGNKYGSPDRYKPTVDGAPSDEFKKNRYVTKEDNQVQEKMDLKKADMGDVVKDFYKSDAPQFKGRSKEKRREMAIAAKLTAEKGKLPEDYSANPAQQAAIAIAKKERKQDLKVSQKKKMKEEVVTELNRFEKEKGMDTKTGKPVTKGGTAKSDKALQFVMKKIGKQRMGGNQPKKVRGAKNPNETSPTKQKMTRMKDAKASSRAFETRAKKSGYKSAQDYANVVARYGSEDNMKKGKGLGS